MCTPKRREPQYIMFLPWISMNHHESVWISMNHKKKTWITKTNEKYYGDSLWFHLAPNFRVLPIEFLLKNVRMIKTCPFFVCGLRNHLESPLYLWLYFVIRVFFCDLWWFILNHGKHMIYCGFFSFQGTHCHPRKSLEWPLDWPLKRNWFKYDTLSF